MAAGRPWYKRSGGDFVMAVIGMPDADHKWAYSAIIDMLNDRDRPLADDPTFICGFTGLSKRKWAVVRAYLITNGYLLTTDDGRLTNPRFERESAERAADHERSVAAGREGGKRSAAARANQGELKLSGEKVPQESPENELKVKDKLEDTAPQQSENNDLAQAPPQPSRARKRLEAREEKEVKKDRAATAITSVEAAALDARSYAAKFGRAGGVAIFPNRPGHFADQLDVIRLWISMGLDPDTEIIPALEKRILDKPAERHSLAYYTPMMADIAARKDATANGAEHPDRSRQHQNPMVRAVERSHDRKNRQ